MSMTAADKKAAIAKLKAQIAEIEAMPPADAPEEMSALDAMIAMDDRSQKAPEPEVAPLFPPETLPEVDVEEAEAKGRMLDEMEPVVARDQKRKRKAERKAAKEERKAAKEEEAADGDVDVSGAAKAVPVDDMDAMNLFRVVHGGDFDPKSSMDKKKLSQIQENLTKDDFKGLSPNQFALKMYRDAS